MGSTRISGAKLSYTALAPGRLHSRRELSSPMPFHKRICTHAHSVHAVSVIQTQTHTEFRSDRPWASGHQWSSNLLNRSVRLTPFTEAQTPSAAVYTTLYSTSHIRHHRRVTSYTMHSGTGLAWRCRVPLAGLPGSRLMAAQW